MCPRLRKRTVWRETGTFEQCLKRAQLRLWRSRGMPTCEVKHQTLIPIREVRGLLEILHTLSKRFLKRRIGASKNLKERPATPTTIAQ